MFQKSWIEIGTCCSFQCVLGSELGLVQIVTMPSIDGLATVESGLITTGLNSRLVAMVNLQFRFAILSCRPFGSQIATTKLQQWKN